MNEFKYEEDKRLLGYVLIHELYKKNKKNSQSTNSSENIPAFNKNDMKDMSNSIYEKVLSQVMKNANIVNQKAGSMGISEPVNMEKTEKIVKDYDISIFTENWKKVLAGIKKVSVMLGALAIESRPDRVENGVLYIKFPKNQKFHSEQVLLPEKKPKIETVINQICNSDITIKTFLESEDSQNEEDKFLQNAVEFFDGEILEKK